MTDQDPDPLAPGKYLPYDLMPVRIQWPEWEVVKEYLCLACREIVNEVKMNSIEELFLKRDELIKKKRYGRMLHRKLAWLSSHSDKVLRCCELLDLVARKEHCEHRKNDEE